ncbi:polysaccharide deacetylase family protein [Novosphingobium jiangmenense]|uniref:Polysaccharide deacetylase family protein n=1 Tax=Novosphingobium jiangmenense TaxID=2791981 RepID=A0ABS0HJT6_9SPHN|nr:polysaccharide deacetylase family protein [Novosphingobium jiangmenense]MBF9152523.1 polysaccharide deacetylase family protein [Novosphingobium jiangmenense]
MTTAPLSPQILRFPAPDDFVTFAPGFGTRFVLTVDTEEEFDWSKPLDRTSHGLDHIPRLAKFQQFCEGAGVKPIYLVDFPVASDPRAAEVLGDAVRAGRAEIGVQLHPWVSPPHDEHVNVHNSFAGNLPAELERAKFRKLRDTIEQAFGVGPMIYRAGRYGVGPNTAAILSDCAIAIDTSVRSRFDYSSTGGPNFRDHPLRPWWIDRRGGLIEMPLTTVFAGLLRQHGPALYPALWRVPRLRGALAHLGLLDRIPLTPEGVTLDEALTGIDMALDDRLPLLVFSFHSPSLRPGLTPYVRSEEDLDLFYDWWRGVFAYLAHRGVAPASVHEIIAAAQV